MGIVPDTRPEKIAFYQNHLTPWGANATEIGLTAQQVGDLASLVIDANNALMAAEAARQASKVATQAYHEAVRAMHNGAGAGASMVSTIQSFAQSTGNPNVYTLAEIPAPQPSSAAPPPGTPTDFTVGLLPVGWLELKWKCENPPNTSGTVYEVQRSVDGGSTFTTIGISGTRSFVDDTLASGCAEVKYRVTGVRSTKRGTTNTLTVQFGVGGTGGVSIVSSTTVPNKDMKLAA